MKHVRSFLLGLLAAVLIVFALVNRGAVTVSLWPFPYEAELPLFVVFFLGLFVGLALAGLLLAMKSVRHHFAMRKTAKEKSEISGRLASLERELDARGPKVEDADYAEDAEPPPLAKRGPRR
ncbi:MAG TPA: lipopolysaccharide assembly protein LapA domain-containing protein [Sphingomonadales bacterium]|nr:lipopolysaccharide assembly protein LapA domain-containing protein [Sphingomonadales bacterium]